MFSTSGIILARRCHFTRFSKCVGSMPVERSRTSIHWSSVNAARAWKSSSMSMFGIWIGFRSRSRNGDPFWSSSIEVFERHDAPDAADQQLFELADDVARDHDPLDAQVGQQRLIDVALLVQRDRHLVDHLEAAALADRGLDLFRFVRPNVVLGQDFLDRRSPSSMTASSFEEQ